MVLSASFGTYPRPDFLREYQIKTYGKQKKQGHVSTDEDDRAMTEAMRRVVEDQTGLDIITDGMLAWDDYLASVAEDFEGIRMGGLIRFYDNNTYYRRPIIEGEIVAKGDFIKNNFSRLNEVNPGEMTKVVIPGPYTLYCLSEDRHYRNKGEGIAAMSAALRKEVEGIDAEYIQIDEPSLSYELDKDILGIIEEELGKLVSATDSKTIIATYFGDLNTCISEIAELEADYIGIDCVSFPDNYELAVQAGIRNMQLGLIDARNTKAEDPIRIKNKIDVLDSDDHIISTNCGLEFLPRKYALRKLDIISAIAKK